VHHAIHVHQEAVYGPEGSRPRHLDDVGAGPALVAELIEQGPPGDDSAAIDVVEQNPGGAGQLRLALALRAPFKPRREQMRIAVDRALVTGVVGRKIDTLMSPRCPARAVRSGVEGMSR
jgi:hypothetical protein